MYYLKHICFTCLAANQKLININDLREEIVSYYNDLIRQTKKEKSKTFEYICEICYSKLESSYNFWLQCVKNRIILNNYIVGLTHTNEIQKDLSNEFDEPRYVNIQEMFVKEENALENDSFLLKSEPDECVTVESCDEKLKSEENFERSLHEMHKHREMVKLLSSPYESAVKTCDNELSMSKHDEIVRLLSARVENTIQQGEINKHDEIVKLLNSSGENVNCGKNGHSERTKNDEIVNLLTETSIIDKKIYRNTQRSLLKRNEIVKLLRNTPSENSFGEISRHNEIVKLLNSTTRKDVETSENTRHLLGDVNKHDEILRLLNAPLDNDDVASSLPLLNELLQPTSVPPPSVFPYAAPPEYIPPPPYQVAQPMGADPPHHYVLDTPTRDLAPNSNGFIEETQRFDGNLVGFGDFDGNVPSESVCDDFISTDSLFICMECNETFFSESKYGEHVSTHPDRKTFECRRCPKTFSVFSSLRRHEKVHLDVGPYDCETCGKGFAKVSNLQVHMRTHKRF